MNLVNAIIVGLAVSYLTFAFCHKNGMFNIFLSIRQLLNLKVLNCSFCLSFYLSLLVHWFLSDSKDLTYLVLSALASGAISSYINAHIVHFYGD